MHPTPFESNENEQAHVSMGNSQKNEMDGSCDL